MIYIPKTSMTPYVLAWFNKDGEEQLTGAQPDNYTNPRISPDGTRVALVIESERNGDIWIWDLVRETMTRLTFDEADDNFPLAILKQYEYGFLDRYEGEWLGMFITIAPPVQFG